jgi:hypothetical protein
MKPAPPEIVPIPRETASSASLSVTVVDGAPLSMWSTVPAMKGKTKGELSVQLQPDQSVVVGRQEGGRIEYLDQSFQPTQMLPHSSERVVATVDRGSDTCVSRGHFTLRGSAAGILFVNGVPRPGGGFRPPLNGTQLLEPVRRPMGQGEEYLIEKGSAIKIRLPNGTSIVLRAG